MNLFVSIIVPVRNGGVYIRDCLNAIYQQSYPVDRYEVIVVDGMSIDTTEKEVRSFIQEKRSLHPLVKIVPNAHKNRGPAMNIGIREAQGDVIIRVDVRNIIPSTYVTSCVRTLFTTQADNVGGCIYPLWKSSKQRAIGMALSHPFGVGNARFRLGKSGFVDTVYLGCYHKNLFSRIGFFDESSPLISEETDINYRIHAMGGRIYCDSDIKVGYYPRETFFQLCRLYYRYGGARAMLVLKHGRFSSLRQLLPLLFFFLVGVSFLGSFVHTIFFIPLGILLLSYGIFAISAGIQSAIQEKKISLAPYITFAFFCMHAPWVIGFFNVLICNGFLKKNINIEA